MSDFRFASALVLSFGLWGAGYALAQPNAAPPTDRADRFVLEAGEHRIEDVIDRAAHFLGKVYLLDAALTQSKMELEPLRFQTRVTLDASRCEDVVAALARTRGLVLSPVDERAGIYEWVFLQGPRREEVRRAAPFLAAEEVLRRRESRRIVTTLVRVSAPEAYASGNLLRQFSPSAGQEVIVLGVPNRPFVWMRGEARELAVLIDLVRAMDSSAALGPRGEGAVRVVSLEELGKEIRGDEQVVTLVPLRGIPSKEAVRAIQRLAPPMQAGGRAGVATSPELLAAELADTVLLRGRADLVAAAARVLQRADTVPEGSRARDALDRMVDRVRKALDEALRRRE